MTKLQFQQRASVVKDIERGQQKENVWDDKISVQIDKMESQGEVESETPPIYTMHCKNGASKFD